ncbi:OmpH family outer membrane protein [Aliikangiella sp. IMCC44653]
MLKKLFVSVLLLVAMLGTASAAGLKIGVVDMQEVIQKTPGLQDVNQKVVTQFKERQDELKKIIKKSEEIQEKVKRDAMTLTNQQKIEFQRELRALEADYKLKEAFFNEDIQAANNIEKRKVMLKVNDAIKQVAADEKLDMIVQKNAVLFNNTNLDITPKVIKVLSNPAG